ncbi:hypothetical protein BGW41_000620 [Actinomortierella wolfii]|nr:hypothetical protein BGW41_000620 [Actinomortierella wolfii]
MKKKTPSIRPLSSASGGMVSAAGGSTSDYTYSQGYMPYQHPYYDHRHGPRSPISPVPQSRTTIGGGGSFSNLIHDDYRPVMDSLKDIYRKKIRPLETTYNFEEFHSAPLTDSDIEAKPIVLLIGQYSTTDRFVAVMSGIESRVIPGNAAAMTADLPFRGLNKFGQAFLTRFQVSQCPAPILENMTLIDTPGILAGNKQRIERGYDFTKTIEWFAERADLILLFFDSHKLDISDEFKSSIYALKGQEEKVRVILNKSDMVNQQQLMRVYGALMWSLGKVIHTPEVMRVYLSSFWIKKPVNAFEDCRSLLDAEQADLLRDLKDLPRNAAIRKVNEIVKRARQAKVHAYIIGHLKKEMPAVFGKHSRQQELIRDLEKEFAKIQQVYGVPEGDFPNVDKFRQSLRAYKFENFSKVKEPILQAVDEALGVDLPKLMRRFPQGNTLESDPLQTNPFSGIASPTVLTPGAEIPPGYFHFSSVDRASAAPIFKSLHPVNDKINGASARPYLMSTGIPVEVLAKIWGLADWDSDGQMTLDEFAVALHLVRAVENGGEDVLPETLPRTMIPCY